MYISYSVFLCYTTYLTHHRGFIAIIKRQKTGYYQIFTDFNVRGLGCIHIGPL